MHSLWAAGRIKSQSGEFAFPKYCSGAHCNANSASAALNKWLRPRAPQGCVIHSFRHSLRDRLREVECPADVIDAIGGWATEGVGHQYGKGHSLNVTHWWMKSLSAIGSRSIIRSRLIRLNLRRYLMVWSIDSFPPAQIGRFSMSFSQVFSASVFSRPKIGISLWVSSKLFPVPRGAAAPPACYGP